MLPTLPVTNNAKFVSATDVFNKNINFDKIKQFFIDNCDTAGLDKERDKVQKGYNSVKLCLKEIRDRFKKYFECDTLSQDKFADFVTSSDVESLHTNIEMTIKLVKKLKQAVLPLSLPLDLKNEKVKKAVDARTAARDPKNPASLPNDLIYTSLLRSSPVKKIIDVFDTLKNNCEQMKVESIKDGSADSFISAVSDLKDMEGYNGPRIIEHQGTTIMARIQSKDLLIEEVYNFSKKSLRQLKVIDQGISKFL